MGETGRAFRGIMMDRYGVDSSSPAGVLLDPILQAYIPEVQQGWRDGVGYYEASAASNGGDGSFWGALDTGAMRTTGGLGINEAIGGEKINFGQGGQPGFYTAAFSSTGERVMHGGGSTLQAFRTLHANHSALCANRLNFRNLESFSATNSFGTKLPTEPV